MISAPTTTALNTISDASTKRAVDTLIVAAIQMCSVADKKKNLHNNRLLVNNESPGSDLSAGVLHFFLGESYSRDNWLR